MRADRLENDVNFYENEEDFDELEYSYELEIYEDEEDDFLYGSHPDDFENWEDDEDDWEDSEDETDYPGYESLDRPDYSYYLF